MTQARDAKIARLFATPAGKDLLSEPWQSLTREEIEQAVQRMRREWATGVQTGSVHFPNPP